MKYKNNQTNLPIQQLDKKEVFDIPVYPLYLPAKTFSINPE